MRTRMKAIVPGHATEYRAPTGSTFEQRFGETLADVVRGLARGAPVAAPVLAGEDWNNLNGPLSDAVTDDSRIGRTVARTTRKRTINGEVVLGPETETNLASGDQIVVLASGNLGLLSFPSIDGRADRHQIDAAYPGMIEGLSSHDGIGFILVRDAVVDDVVLGSAGERHLDGDRIEGVDPLAPFGVSAADHLRRTRGFTNCPDILVNGVYGPVTDEGAAFEDLIGFHGGLGGKQCGPFVLAPIGLTQLSEQLVGARSVHDLFKTWLSEVQGDGWT